MDYIRALRISIGCVMASGMDSETKNEVIAELVEIEEIIEGRGEVDEEETHSKE